MSLEKSYVLFWNYKNIEIGSIKLHKFMFLFKSIYFFKSARK